MKKYILSVGSGKDILEKLPGYFDEKMRRDYERDTGDKG